MNCNPPAYICSTIRKKDPTVMPPFIGPLCQTSKVLGAALFSYVPTAEKKLLVAYNDRIEAYSLVFQDGELFLEGAVVRNSSEDRIRSIHTVEGNKPGEDWLLAISDEDYVTLVTPGTPGIGEEQVTLVLPDPITSEPSTVQRLVAVGKKRFAIYTSTGYAYLYCLSLVKKGNKKMVAEWTLVDSSFVNTFFAKCVRFDAASENLAIACGGPTPKLLVLKVVEIAARRKPLRHILEFSFEVNLPFDPVDLSYLEGQWIIYGETQFVTVSKDTTPIVSPLGVEKSNCVVSATPFQEGTLVSAGDLFYHNALGYHKFKCVDEHDSFNGPCVWLKDDLFFVHQPMKSSIVRIDIEHLEVSTLNWWQNTVAPILDIAINSSKTTPMPSILAVTTDRVLQLQISRTVRVFAQLDGLPQIVAGPWFPAKNIMVFSIKHNTVVMEFDEKSAEFSLVSDWLHLDLLSPSILVTSTKSCIIQVTSNCVTEVNTGQTRTLGESGAPVFATGVDSLDAVVLVSRESFMLHRFDKDLLQFNLQSEPSCISCQGVHVAIGTWSGDVVLVNTASWAETGIADYRILPLAQTKIHSIVLSYNTITVSSTNVTSHTYDGFKQNNANIPCFAKRGTRLFQNAGSLISISDTRVFLHANGTTSRVLLGDTYTFGQPVFSQERRASTCISPGAKVNVPQTIIQCPKTFNVFGDDCLVFCDGNNPTQLSFTTIQTNNVSTGVVDQHILEESDTFMYEHIEALADDIFAVTYLEKPNWVNDVEIDHPHYDNLKSQGVEFFSTLNLTSPLARCPLSSLPVCLRSLAPWYPLRVLIGDIYGGVRLYRIDPFASDANEVAQHEAMENYDVPIVDIKISSYNKHTGELDIFVCTERSVTVSKLGPTSEGKLEFLGHGGKTISEDPTEYLGILPVSNKSFRGVAVFKQFVKPELIRISPSNDTVSLSAERYKTVSATIDNGPFLIYGADNGYLYQLSVEESAQTLAAVEHELWTICDSRINQIRSIPPIKETVFGPDKNLAICCTADGGLYVMVDSPERYSVPEPRRLTLLASHESLKNYLC